MLKRISLSLLFVVLGHSAFADDLFSINITSPDSIEPFIQTFTDINDLIDASQQSSLAINLDGYNQASAAEILIRLGDKNARIDYAANSTELVFTFGECDIPNETFNEGSRERNEEAFRDFVDNNRQNLLDCTNSNSGTETVITGIDNWAGSDIGKDADDEESGTAVGLSVGRYSIGNQNHNVLTIPISYTHYFEEEGRKLRLSAPISYIDINGSKVFKVSGGAAYTRPMNEKWTVIPAFRVGLTGSDDMAIGATTVSATVTNQYEFSHKNKHITLSNMLGLMTSLDYSIGDFNSYYDVDNQVIKNGITVEYPLTYKMFGGETSMEFSLANTQFFGTKVFVDNYTDIAVSMGTRRKVGGKDNTQDSMQLGFTFTTGKRGYRGGKINFGYKF